MILFSRQRRRPLWWIPLTPCWHQLLAWGKRLPRSSKVADSPEPVVFADRLAMTRGGKIKLWLTHKFIDQIFNVVVVLIYEKAFT